MSRSRPIILVGVEGDEIGVIVLGPAKAKQRAVWECARWPLLEAGPELAHLADVYGPRDASWATGSRAEDEIIRRLVGAAGIWTGERSSLAPIGRFAPCPMPPPDGVLVGQAVPRAVAMAAGVGLRARWTKGWSRPKPVMDTAELSCAA